MYAIDIPSTGGIYKITCVPNSLIYIGSAKDLRKRYLGHFGALRRNDHENPKLQNAFNKYGEDAFTFEILEYVLLPELLTTREQYWLDKLQPYKRNKGFNLSPTAGNCLGIKSSPETCAKISASLMGNTRCVGRIESSETRAKKAASHLGVKRPPEVGKKIGDTQRNRKATPEQIEKNRLGHLGKPSGGLGLKRTAETRTKMSKDYIVTSPEGIEFPIHNLRQFCMDHGLSDGHLTQVAQGKRAHYKGWKVRYAGIEPCVYVSKKDSLKATLIITAPDGTEYVATGIAQFCREHGLVLSALMAVAKGKYKHHKGWIARYPDAM